VAATGNVKLKVDFAGWASGMTAWLDPNSNIFIIAYPEAVQNWSGTNAACKYQRFQIYVGWYSALTPIPIWHWDNVGSVVYGHLGTFNYTTPGQSLPSMAQHWREDGGSGWVYYPDVVIGTEYLGNDGATPVGTVCSSGAHAHMESFSAHAYGATLEHHGTGPDFYWTNHVEYPPGYPQGPSPLGPKSPSQGYSATYVGGWAHFLGGNTIVPGMW
jgi:hypothetical protein